MKNSIDFGISIPNLVNIVLHEFHRNYSNQLPDFSFKMHQIQFRLRLRRRPAEAAHSAPHASYSLAGFERGREKEGRKREKGRRGKRKDDSGPRRGSTPYIHTNKQTNTPTNQQSETLLFAGL